VNQTERITQAKAIRCWNRNPKSIRCVLAIRFVGERMNVWKRMPISPFKFMREAILFFRFAFFVFAGLRM
jgi:hypothetical protein